MRKENKFRNVATATALANTILAQDDFCKLYSLTSANMNTESIEDKNKLTTFNESFETAKAICESMKLQENFMKAVSRCELYCDNDYIVMYIGAVYDVYVLLAEKDETARERYTELYNATLDKKYNERKIKNVTITALTETKHKFDSVEQFTEFFELFSQFVVARKSIETATENKAETAHKTENKSKERKSKSKTKERKTKISDVSAQELAQLTQEIVEAESKKA